MLYVEMYTTGLAKHRRSQQIHRKSFLLYWILLMFADRKSLWHHRSSQISSGHRNSRS